MLNIITKTKLIMLLCLLGCFGTTQPFLQSLSQTLYINQYGNEDASQEYLTLIRSFLKNSGVKKPDQVPVKQFCQKGLKRITPITLARTVPSGGIWLCEKRLEPFNRAVRIFTLAHEVAHYTETLWQVLTTSIKNREKNADLKAAQLLCEHDYAWVVSDFITYVENMINEGSNFIADTCPTFQEQLTYLQKFYTAWQGKNAKSTKRVSA